MLQFKMASWNPSQWTPFAQFREGQLEVGIRIVKVYATLIAVTNAAAHARLCACMPVYPQVTARAQVAGMGRDAWREVLQ
jgi:hypothetical protein